MHYSTGLQKRQQEHRLICLQIYCMQVGRI
nr:MAG TPA: hypothetical protein [Caudoviricetes sp.]